MKTASTTVGAPALSENWQRSSAHLGIVRADLHVSRTGTCCSRAACSTCPKPTPPSSGALAAVYHHLGDNFKIGVGYNFGRFSDDLRDLTLNDQGIFLNAIAKF